jgi:hypothetical protein
MTKPKKPVGLTKDVGWQFGISKTFYHSQSFLWDFMFSDQGLKIWLGETEEELENKKSFRTKEGIEGFIRVFNPYSHIRMNWKKPEWENMSTVQVRVMGDEKKAIISFHQEKMTSSAQREEMRAYWNRKMDEISKTLENG